jgi:hypothetical protein
LDGLSQKSWRVVCAHRSGGAGLYIGGRDPKEKGESQQQHLGRQTDGMCQMIPPMNEGESSSRVCPPPPPPPPTYRPADRQTHKPTETHTRKRGASSSALRMRRKEIKSRRCVRAFSSPLFSSSPPIISQRETPNTKTTQTPAHVISVVNIGNGPTRRLTDSDRKWISHLIY